jgi:hypothetical protein
VGLDGVKIELSRDGGGTWEELASSINAAAGRFTWTATGPGTASCLVRISDAADGLPADASDAAFAIAGIAVTSPNGAETWYYQGADQEITWTSGGIAGNVDIHYSTDGGGKLDACGDEHGEHRFLCVGGPE